MLGAQKGRAAAAGRGGVGVGAGAGAACEQLICAPEAWWGGDQAAVHAMHRGSARAAGGVEGRREGGCEGDGWGRVQLRSTRAK